MSSPKSLSDLLNDKGLTERDLKQEIKEEHCHIIAMQVGKDWQTLALFIGISDIDIDDIKERYEEPQDRRLALLRKWKKLYGSEATYAKMIKGLEGTGNRQVTEYLLDMLKRSIHVQCHSQGENREMGYSTFTAKSTRNRNKKRKKKEKERGNKHEGKTAQRSQNPSKSKVTIFAVVCGVVLLFLVCICIVYNTMKDGSITLLLTPQEQPNTSVIVQWSPKVYNSTNCSQPVGHDLPTLYDIFVGREDDIKEITRKAMNVNIFNINGAPGFGKSTVAIHAGNKLLNDCIPVRYIDMEGLSWKTLSEFMNESERKIETEWKPSSKFNNYKQQTVALTTFDTSLTAKEVTILGSSTYKSSYIKELKQWSKAINQTTVLIFDNADVIPATSFHISTNFMDLISLLVHNSEMQLHIIIVSQEKLLPLRRWTVRQLSQQASVELLTKLAPSVADRQLNKIAELLQGCPLALKVIGNILDIYGENITHELEDELRQQPIDVLDKVTNHKHRFRVIMDLVFSKLGFLRCGYIVSLFPDSFSREAGIEILASKECLEMFERQSLLDEYFLGYQHRYRMHRLIREYLKEKINITDKLIFQKGFCKYYTQYLLQHYATESKVNDIYKHEHELSTESKNIDLFVEKMLLTNSQRNFSIDELSALAFLVSKGYLQFDKLQSSFKQYLMTLNNISVHLDSALCGQLISHIVKHFYEICKCDTPLKYIDNIFNYPCEGIFDCEVIIQLFSMRSVLNLTQREETFLYNMQAYQCLDKFLLLGRILIILLFFTVLFYISYDIFLLISSTYRKLSDSICRIVHRFLLLLMINSQLNSMVKSDVLIKFFCYLPSILLAIFIFICFCCCYYKFHPFPLNVYHHLSHNSCALVLIFITIPILLILHTVLFDRCSQLPICY